MTKTHSIARLTAGIAATLIGVALAGPAFSQAQSGGKPAQNGAAQGGAAAEPEVKFSASPWRKICQENPQNKKQVCVLTQILGVESQAIAKVDIIEMKDEPKKRLNVSVPLGMRLQPGLRITLDKDPVAIPFIICQPIQGGGATCVGDVEVDAGFIAKLKKANAVYLQMVNGVGRTLSLPISNADFGKAYDGPGVDAKVAMEEEKKRLEEARAKQQALEEQNKAALLKKGQELEKANQSGK
ncbi:MULTISPECIES: invasion associated locus B family protein [unclassified Xanthobacter]|uniref:invasion associated locus B family protein n=1 Tax=unclassified Xanthobacter TaxID=2623496 RepID=UPI001EDFCC27|nr:MULTISPECIES: invasion associated locus B family protein [unclassified Xanthobacter]